jgi:hypothetical protein
MKTTRLSVLATAIILGSINIASAKGGGGGTSTVSATGTFADRSGDYISSDGGGSYMDGQQGVTSHIDTFGDWDLNLYNSSRSLYITMPTSISGCTLPYSNERVEAYFALQHANLENMTVGSTQSVQYTLTIIGSSGAWGLFFWPQEYPGGTYGATAHRLSQASWVITGDPTATAAVVKSGHRGYTTCGTATGVNFSVTVTTP